MLMAGLDGVQQQDRAAGPGRPRHLRDEPPRRRSTIAGTPGSLEEVLDALEADHEYLLSGDVFTPDVIATYIEYKRAGAKQVALRPHPYEFYLYSEM